MEQRFGRPVCRLHASSTCHITQAVMATATATTCQHEKRSWVKASPHPCSYADGAKGVWSRQFSSEDRSRAGPPSPAHLQIWFADVGLSATPYTPVSPSSTVTTRRFCARHEASSQSFTRRSFVLP
jgi:hypothetical protein